MTRRKILTISSRKKRDTMLPRSIKSGTGGYNRDGHMLFYGNNTRPDIQAHIMMWCPTARDLTNFEDLPNYAAAYNQRTSQTCYMKGLRENVHLQTSNGSPWQWRRICFTTKGDDLRDVEGSSDDDMFMEDSSGFRRLMRSYTHVESTQAERAQVARWMTRIFQGEYGTDYNDIISAKTDTSHISVKYDVTRFIQSGNQSGVLRNYKIWHPMEANLVYDDEEHGDRMESRKFFSVTGKQGMGDYYIMDIFNPHGDAVNSGELLFNPNSTLYWHER